MSAYFPDQTTDDIPFTEALKRLEDQGADVVGLNCSRGPDTMLPLLKEVRKVCKVLFLFYEKKEKIFNRDSTCYM